MTSGPASAPATPPGRFVVVWSTYPDAAAAEAAADLGERRRKVGRIVDVHDGFIAGIAISRGATLATRNLRHFADCPFPVIDPWAG